MSEKTIAEELAAALATVASLSAESKAANELTAEAQSQLAAKDAQLGELAGKLTAAENLIATGNAALADLTAKLTAAESAKVAAEKAASDLKNAVEKNPAFAHAAAGRKPVEDVGNGSSESGNTMSATDFRALNPEQKTAFAKRGGKIISD